MPEYLMRCPNGHERTVEQPMITDDVVICGICGLSMWRKPMAPMINWNGLRPSQGEHSPQFQRHFRDIDRIRDETDKKYEERNG
jgi:hypothetical protein